MNYLTKAKDLYSDKKVLILGLGINEGGVGSARFFAKAGAKVKVTDLKRQEILQTSLNQLNDFPEIEYTLGEHKNSDIDWADIIIRNPAIKPENPYLKYAESKGKKIEMDLGIFLQFVPPSQIIGITGTKGKSTTASLIYEVLKNDKEVILAGTIGKSMLDTLEHCSDESFIILELSSFQLQALTPHKISPKYSIITNIFPDHLNYHSSMEEYTQVKKEIVRYQTSEDFVFLNQDDEICGNPEFIKDLRGQVIYYSFKDLPDDFSPKLPGEHNRSNFAAALKVADIFGISVDQSLENMAGFSGVEFRLQLVKEVNGVKIYNDSAATNPNAAVEAMKALPDSIIICGGMNKGLSYLEMANAIDQHAKRVYLIEGDATEELRLLVQAQVKLMGTYNNLEELITDVLEEAESGDNIVFTPGATSFNFWQNEFDRGRKFNQALEKVVTN